MSNQNDNSGWPSNISQIKWAMRHGQKIDGLENMVLSNQPIMLNENHVDNMIENNSNSQNVTVHNTVLEEQIHKLERSLNQEILSLKSEFEIVAQGTAVEEQIEKLGQTLNQEILSLKSEFGIVAQGTAVEEQIEKLGQTLNQEILSLKSEFGIVAQGTAVEEQIEKLGQTLNQEILSLKSEFGIVAQGMAVEEQIEKLGQTLNQEILSLKGEFGIVAQDTALEEQIEKLGQTLNQEILSLKSEFGIVAQDTALEEQIEKLGQTLNQEILSLRNEFTMLVQTQLNQQKDWKIVEFEWENSVKSRETQLQEDIREMQHNIMGKVDEHFQYLDAQFQDHDNMLRQELSLLTSKLEGLQQIQTSKEELQVTPWQKKLEERQTRLIEDVDYIQYVVEEMATRPQNNEAQQKLREKFFIREISALKEEIAVVCQKWKTMGNGYAMTDIEQYNKGLPQQGIDLDSEEQTKIYKKRKRR